MHATPRILRPADFRARHNGIVAILAVLAWCWVPRVDAATIVVNNTNGAGQGFNSTTPVDPVTGNPATTLGAQRLAAFQAAADAWGAMLVSSVTIRVNAQMTSLTCTAMSATLGSAGASNAYRDFPGAPIASTWYASALADALAGQDLSPGNPDISANFNQNIGTPGCLQNSPWSYVIGAPVPAGSISFFNTVIHEIGHGLGFFTLVNKSSGAPMSGFFDIYARFLLDETPTPTLWTALNNAGRAASATDNGNLTWAGAEVLNVAGLLSTGRHASGRVRMYAPTTLASGSSVSHFDSVLTPNEIMEHTLQSVNQKLLTNHLMLDIGWQEMLALAVTMTDGQSSVPAGSATSYTATITNNGPGHITVVDAGVIDNLPAALTGATWTCGGTGGATCETANGADSISTTVSIPLNGVITFTIAATIDANFTGTLSNTMAVTMPGNIQNTMASSAVDQTNVTMAVPVSVSTISGSTTEAGGEATFSVVLLQQPTANVTIGISSAETTEGTVAPSSLQFTNGNWDNPKVVTVTGVNDDVDDDDQPYQVITAAAVSSDTAFSGRNPADVAVVNLDDDAVGITVSAISGNTTEAGGTASFSVVLNTEPTQNVSIGLSSSDTTEGTVSPSSVVFTSGDWDTQQVVTVTGVNDDVDDDNIAFSIVTAAATSTDPKYNGLNAGDVSVTNTDNDVAGVTVSAISGNTTEAGESATFTIVLTSEPTHDVSVGLSSSDTTEGTVLPVSVTFSSGEWDTPKQVTVTGVDDALEDDAIVYSITTAPATSTDPKYNTLNAADVAVTNLDNEGDTIHADSFEQE